MYFLIGRSIAAMDTFVGKYERVHEENYEELLKVKFLTLTLNLALVAISTLLPFCPSSS